MQKCHKIARTKLKKTKHRVAQQLSEVNVPKLVVGNKVLLKNKKAEKLDPIWLGPFNVIEIDPNGSNVTMKVTKKI